ncbi:Uncharacterised protein [Mycoplasmopsis edwardii]|uniref:Uncharacterized protein n=1 Tax=Mycoplasmopsis edwardii TaxID=53558 RepID=A0A3B0PQ71_9BACT|nr:Uncharacterised protein [Mycoplasmopsis edwardii]
MILFPKATKASIADDNNDESFEYNEVVNLTRSFAKEVPSNVSFLTLILGVLAFSASFGLSIKKSFPKGTNLFK